MGIIYRNKKSAIKEAERKQKKYGQEYFVFKTTNHYLVISKRLLNNHKKMNLI